MVTSEVVGYVWRQLKEVGEEKPTFLLGLLLHL
jgi:hypothetical protein